MKAVASLLFLLNLCSFVVATQNNAECGSEEDGVCVKGKNCVFSSNMFDAQFFIFLGPENIPWQEFGWKCYAHQTTRFFSLARPRSEKMKGIAVNNKTTKP